LLFLIGLMSLVSTLMSCGQTVPNDVDLSRVKTIVSAIESYKAEKGSPPESLKNLKPELLGSIKFAELDDTAKYLYSRDASQFQLEVVAPRIPTRSVVLFRSNGDYKDCIQGASVNPSFKIIEAVPAEGMMVLHEQTD
jgi:hypothetical protein